MTNRNSSRLPPPGSALDGTRETLLSGIWVAKPFVPIEAFPQELVLTASDRKLASKLRAPLCLCRRQMGPHVVELLLERGQDRSVDLSLRIPTAQNQFKEPYILMEAESGNSREVALREVQFHLQGRLPQRDLAGADWADYFGRAARRLEALRGAGRKTKKSAGTRKRPTRTTHKAGAHSPRGARSRTSGRS